MCLNVQKEAEWQHVNFPCNPLMLTGRQGSRLTFQPSSLVASERFDFTSQNKFSLARLTLCSICLMFSRVNYCKERRTDKTITVGQ